MAIQLMELASFKREDFKEGEVWEARWHDGKGNERVLLRGTVLKVRARGVEIHWSDGSNTYEVPFKAFVKKVK